MDNLTSLGMVRKKKVMDKITFIDVEQFQSTINE